MDRRARLRGTRLHLSGALDEVMILARALSAAEIATLYASYEPTGSSSTPR